MDLAAVLFLIALFLVVGLFLAAPLIGGLKRRETAEAIEVSSLMAERDRVINSLQELDFDFKLGKIPEEDYPAQRTDLLQKGADILRKLDTVAPSLSPSPSGTADANARIEQAAAAGRVDGSGASAELDDATIESMLAARRAVRRTKSAGFCPRCGKPVLVTDQFCPNCGKVLK
jgi:hypothetical protein